MTEFVLHAVPGSPFLRSALLALEEKGLTYRVVALAPGGHRTEAYARMNPFLRMPVLQHGDFTLYETAAILRYLDRVAPTPALTPTDPRAAARMDQVMSIVDWYLFPGVSSVIGFHRLVGPKLLGLTPDEAAIAAAMPAAHRVIGALEGFLAQSDYFAGDSVTLADLHALSHVDFLGQTPEWAELSKDRPRLCDWLARMSARPAAQATTWERVSAAAAAA